MYFLDHLLSLQLMHLGQNVRKTLQDFHCILSRFVFVLLILFPVFVLPRVVDLCFVFKFFKKIFKKRGKCKGKALVVIGF